MLNGNLLIGGQTVLIVRGMAALPSGKDGGIEN